MFEIKELPVEEIKVYGRARKTFGEIAKLKESITTHGLLYPILIDENYKLLDGGRRLKAHKELDLPTVFCRILPGVSADDAKIIELISNAERKEFIWHEELKIKYDLHYIWKKENTKWGYRDTAKRLNCALGGISSDLALMEAIKVLPELTQFQTKSKARDAYKKMQDRAVAIQSVDGLSTEENERLQSMLSGSTDLTKVTKTGKEKESTPAKEPFIPTATHSDRHPGESLSGKENREEELTPQKETNELPKHVYEIISNREFIPKMPDNTVGFVEIDPPYAIDFNETYGKIKNIDATEDDWAEEKLRDWMNDMLPIIHEKMLDNSWVLCWTGKEHWNWINDIAASIGFGVQGPGIWAKANGGSSNTPKTTMISNYEMFLLFRKGKATFNTPSLRSVVNFHFSHPSQRGHQWQKPMDMYGMFMETLGKPESIFLSPFAGSGNSMVSAAINGMIPMGCDMKKQYFYQFYNNFKNHFYSGR